MLMFDGFAEMTFTILRLPGFYKQRGEYSALWQNKLLPLIASISAFVVSSAAAMSLCNAFAHHEAL